MPGEVFAREPSADRPFPVRLDAPARRPVCLGRPRRAGDFTGRPVSPADGPAGLVLLPLRWSSVRLCSRHAPSIGSGGNPCADDGRFCRWTVDKRKNKIEKIGTYFNRTEELRRNELYKREALVNTALDMAPDTLMEDIR